MRKPNGRSVSPSSRRDPRRKGGALAVFALLAAAGPAGAQMRFDRGGFFAVGPEPAAVAVGDVNRDGVPDVFCLSRAFDRLTLAVGRYDRTTGDWVGTAVEGDGGGSGGESGGYGGGGGSDGPAGFSTPGDPVDVAVTDLNRDGRSDVIVVGKSSRTVSVRVGSMSGSLSVPIRNTVQHEPFRVRGTDLDADGYGDALFGTSRALYAIFGHVGPVLPPVEVFRSEGPADLVGFDVADADGDERLDIVVVRHFSGGVRPAEAVILTGDGTGAFTAGEPFEIHPALSLVVDARAADVDGDGTPEIVASADPSGVFVRPLGGASSGVIPTANTLIAIDFADVDRDGLPDLVAASSGASDTLDVHCANGHGGFESPLRFQIGAEPRRFALADMDRDGRRDVVTTSAGFDRTEPGSFELHLDRSGAFRDAGTVNAAAGPLADVVLVNGSIGGPRRFVAAAPGEPLRIEVLAPPAAGGSSPFALFVWTADPNRGPGAELPHGIGSTCLPTPLSPGEPQPTFGWNATRREGIASYLLPCGPAPCVPLDSKRGLRRPASFFVQGFIADPASAADRAVSVTNGVLVDVR